MIANQTLPIDHRWCNQTGVDLTLCYTSSEGPSSDGCSGTRDVSNRNTAMFGVLGIVVLSLVTAVHARQWGAKVLGEPWVRTREYSSVAPEPQAQMAAVVPVLEVQRRYAEAPNSARPIHPEDSNFFWRYYKPDDGNCAEWLPCEYGACCGAFCKANGATLHGEIAAWANKKSAPQETAKWLLCPCCQPCMVGNDRNSIERTIHDFHRERGDAFAQRERMYPGDTIIGPGMVPGLGLTLHAQNYWVMKKFQEVQREYLAQTEVQVMPVAPMAPAPLPAPSELGVVTGSERNDALSA